MIARWYAMGECPELNMMMWHKYDCEMVCDGRIPRTVIYTLLEENLTDFGIYCSVLEWGKGFVGWGGLINLNSVCLRFTASSWKKGYSCYISFFTNFVLIYWTCLIGFGGKSHRSCNLANTVGDLD